MIKSYNDETQGLEVERCVFHAERDGFRISELQISGLQKIPWHYHNQINDTFYVLEGEITVYLREPKESVPLAPGQTFQVEAKRPHMVSNSGEGSATFLVLQGLGEYDNVPLLK